MKAWCAGTAILFENPVPGWGWLGCCRSFFDWAGWIQHDEELVDLAYRRRIDVPRSEHACVRSIKDVSPGNPSIVSWDPHVVVSV